LNGGGRREGVTGSQVETYQTYINGRWVRSLSGETFPVYDPSTEAVIAHVASSNAADIDLAVKAARAAFDASAWRATTAQSRGRILLKLAEKVRQNAKQLSELESRNSGKPIVEAELDIDDVATCFEYYGGLATKVFGASESRTGERSELYLARACRRCWPNRSLEFSHWLWPHGS